MSKTKQKAGGSSATVRRVLKLIAPYRVLVLLSLLLAAVTVVTTLYAPILTGRGVDLILGPGQVDLSALASLAVQFGIVVCITSLSQWLMSLINNRITFQVVRDIRVRAFSHMEQLPLRYIDAPAPSAVFAAVQKAEQAVLLLSHPTKEQMLSFFALNPMVMKYVPKDCVISRDELKEVLRRVLSQDDVPEPYVRAFINCSALDMSPVDKVLFVDQWGSAKAKKITVDEKLTIK